MKLTIKQMQIAVIVNKCKAVYPFALSAQMYTGHKQGKINGYHFNKCVTELSEASWLNKDAPGEPQYYEMYKLAWRDSLIADEFEAHKINDAIVKEVQLCDEWQNGDECEWLNGSGGGVFVGLLPHNNEIAVISQGEFTFNMLLSGLSRPETLEQKAAKERNDKAIELCKLRCESFGHRYNWDALGEKKKEGYRKMIDAGVQLPE